MEDGEEYSKVKKAMKVRISSKKPQAIVMKEAVSLRYQGGAWKRLIEDADRCYRSENFNDESKLELFREAVRSHPMILQLTTLKGAKDYETFKTACAEFAENQKILNASGVTMPLSSAPKEDRVDILCRQMKNLTL